jgi:peroxiredoxin
MKKWRCLTFVMALAVASCSNPSSSGPQPHARRAPSYDYGEAGGSNIFDDNAKTNTTVEPAALDLSFTDRKGNRVDLKQYRGKKNVVLVVTRGYAGHFCPCCTSQTSRLINQYGEFARRDAEILLVFPGPKDHLEQFLQGAEERVNCDPTPFPVLLDENFTAVDKLGIRGELAKPSTYILDKQGQIRFAYVGSTYSDRPSVKALLKQLDEITKS